MREDEIMNEELMDEQIQRNRYLTFHMGKEDYGIPIYNVMEIIGGMQPITEIPERADYEKGVINLRGKIVPVIDVRLRFSLPAREYTDRTCIIVTSIDDIVTGLIVDEVSEVMDIPEESIDPPPTSMSDAKSQFIKGMGIIGKKVKIILDVERIVNSGGRKYTQDVIQEVDE